MKENRNVKEHEKDRWRTSKRANEQDRNGCGEEQWGIVGMSSNEYILKMYTYDRMTCCFISTLILISILYIYLFIYFKTYLRGCACMSAIVCVWLIDKWAHVILVDWNSRILLYISGHSSNRSTTTITITQISQYLEGNIASILNMYTSCQLLSAVAVDAAVWQRNRQRKYMYIEQNYLSNSLAQIDGIQF